MSLFLARLYPEKVKAVILLASPCQLGFNDIATNTGFGNLFKFIQAGKKLFDQDVLRNWVGEQDRIPVLDVPIISFVSCDDKNVNGLSCEAPIGPLNRTIYINTNHSGVKNHPATKAALVFLYKNGWYAEFPDEIIKLGIVDRSHLVNHFAKTDPVIQIAQYPPQLVTERVLSIA